MPSSSPACALALTEQVRDALLAAFRDPPG
jgi:hypothetical protein